MSDPIAKRLVKLESNVAHLEHLCEQLNQVVVAQGKQLARLQAQQEQAGKTLATIELERIKANNPKPPHYQ